MLPDKPHCDHIQLIPTLTGFAFLRPIGLMLLIHCSSEGTLENMQNMGLDVLKLFSSLPTGLPETRIVFAGWFALTC